LISAVILPLAYTTACSTLQAMNHDTQKISVMVLLC